MHEPSSAYIHVPFCSHHCGYCNFTLISGRSDLVEPFLEALELELKSVLSVPKLVHTIFIGGGTPSYLSPQELHKLLEIVLRWLAPSAQAEFSCELNPIHCDAERLRVLRDFGVNRLSLGGQSFSDRKLQVLERDHDGRQLQAALEVTSERIANVSLDLIFAAPGETLREWQADVRQALKSPIKHLSTYGLTIERGAAFYGRNLRGAIEEVDADLQLAMYEHAMDAMADVGWDHYEVSNFACPGFRCRHNENYWLGEPWWAFGPGAASFVENQDGEGSFLRNTNHRSTTSYIKRVRAGRSPVAESDAVTREQLVRERLVFGLRRLEGVSLQQLSEQWGSPVRPLFEPYLSNYLEQGWLKLDASNRLQLTRPGLVISDGLWPDLLGSPSA